MVKSYLPSSYSDPRSGYTDPRSGYTDPRISFTDPSNNISINVNESLLSWLDYDNIIFKAIFPENFRYIISGPSECGKTFLLKNLVMTSIL